MDFNFRFCLCIILVLPHQTQLGEDVIEDTALIKASPFTSDRYGRYSNHDEVNDWIKTHHDVDNEFSLHQACSSFNPLDEVIFDIVKRQGLKAFKKSDTIEVTASQHLTENPYTTKSTRL